MPITASVVPPMLPGRDATPSPCADTVKLCGPSLSMASLSLKLTSLAYIIIDCDLCIDPCDSLSR